MAKARRERKASPPPAAKVRVRRSPLAGWGWLGIVLLVIAAFYWDPLTSRKASIQWDAVDVHYLSQKYFADRIHQAELPFWSPYIFSGFPFLADPQVGAWYPLNWPFFLAGITPRAIEFELALHALVACAGAFLLLRRLTGSAAASLAGAFAYGLSGFFAGHSSHVGMFSAASLFPWLLLAFDRAMQGGLVRFAALGGLAGGLIVLAGHFQTALYGFAGLGLFSVGEIGRSPRLWKRAACFLAMVVVLAAGLSMIEVLPGMELTALSMRSDQDFSASAEGALEWRALATLALPNALGALSPRYEGPGDVTQYYFYAGFLLLPLAIAGAGNSRLRIPALALIVPAVLYMLGPAAGLYRLSAILPGFQRVRAPVHGWFVAGFGLALLAGSGLAWVEKRWKNSYLAPAMVLVVALDLCLWNSWKNPLAYARNSFGDLYGVGMNLAESRVAPAVPAMTRLDGPDSARVFGPLNHPLEVRLETTYGYNPLALRAYQEYRESMARNPKLRDALTVSRYLDAPSGGVMRNPTALPRAMFPREILEAGSDDEAKQMLDGLDPARQAVVLRPRPPIQQDGQAAVTEISAAEQSYRIRYRAGSTSLLRVGVPYFPGWVASVEGVACEVRRVDHALLGVVVPGGEKQLDLRFRSTRFAMGSALSLAGLLVVAGLYLRGGALLERRGR